MDDKEKTPEDLVTEAHEAALVKAQKEGLETTYEKTTDTLKDFKDKTDAIANKANPPKK